MKFTVEKKVFQESLNIVGGAVSSKSLIPILSGVKLTVKENGLRLTGSNGDVSIFTFIPSVNGDETLLRDVEEGSVVVQAKLFNEIIKKLPDNSVTIDVDSDYHISIKSGKSKFKLNGQDAEEFPKLPNVSDENSFEIASSLLKEVINETVFAVSTQETRPILTGVNFRVSEGKLTFVATDSHRLSQIIADTTATFSEDINTTIPGSSLKELNKILSNTDELVKVSLSSNLILFETGNTLFYSRLLDGNYPDTRRLIPDSEKTKIKASKKDLIGCLERASVLAEKPVVKLTVNGGLMAEISSNTPEIGNVTEDVVMSDFEGEDITLSFSAKFAIEALKAVNSDEIVISLNGSMRPFTIKPIDDESVLQLVLPVRTF